jgi:hypothetical protein
MIYMGALGIDAVGTGTFPAAFVARGKVVPAKPPPWGCCFARRPSSSSRSIKFRGGKSLRRHDVVSRRGFGFGILIRASVAGQCSHPKPIPSHPDRNVYEYETELARSNAKRTAEQLWHQKLAIRWDLRYVLSTARGRLRWRSIPPQFLPDVKAMHRAIVEKLAEHVGEIVYKLLLEILSNMTTHVNVRTTTITEHIGLRGENHDDVDEEEKGVEAREIQLEQPWVEQSSFLRAPVSTQNGLGDGHEDASHPGEHEWVADDIAVGVDSSSRRALHESPG